MSVNQLRDAAADILGRVNLFKFEPPSSAIKESGLEDGRPFPLLFVLALLYKTLPRLVPVSLFKLQPLANVGNPPAPGRTPSS